MIRLFIMILVSFMPFSRLYAGDITIELLKQAQTSDILNVTNVELITINKERYLISVGVSDIKDGRPKSKLNAIKTSKLKAEEGAIKFIAGSKVKSEEHLKEKEINNNQNSSYQNVLSEHTSSHTGVYIYLGEWIKNNFYYTAIAYPF